MIVQELKIPQASSEKRTDYSMQLGYKQTVVGSIPSDWTVRKLGDLGRVIRGSSPRPKGDPRYYGGKVPRLMVEDVTRDGKIVFPSVDFLTEEGAKLSRPCRRGTLTIVCSGTVGVVSFLGIDACIHDGFLGLVQINKSACDEYIYYQLQSLREAFDDSATHGGVFTNLTTSGVKEFAIAMPPTLAEQEAIAEALGDADALVESLERLLAKKRNLKQAVMQQLLTGRKRLPGFEGEWEEKTLQEISEFANGKPLEGQIKPDGQFNLITLDSISIDGQLKKEHKQTDFGEALLEVGDIVSVLSDLAHGYLLGLCDVIPANNQYVLNQRMGRLRLNVDGDSKYVRLQINRRQNHFKKRGQGTSQRHIYKRDFGSLEIPFPEPKEQAAIATVLSDMDEEISAIEDKIGKARLIKAGMMQELLTGKKRLV